MPVAPEVRLWRLDSTQDVVESMWQAGRFAVSSPRR